MCLHLLRQDRRIPKGEIADRRGPLRRMAAFFPAKTERPEASRARSGNGGFQSASFLAAVHRRAFRNEVAETLWRMPEQRRHRNKAKKQRFFAACPALRGNGGSRRQALSACASRWRACVRALRMATAISLADCSRNQLLLPGVVSRVTTPGAAPFWPNQITLLSRKNGIPLLHHNISPQRPNLPTCPYSELFLCFYRNKNLDSADSLEAVRRETK